MIIIPMQTVTPTSFRTAEQMSPCISPLAVVIAILGLFWLSPSDTGESEGKLGKCSLMCVTKKRVEIHLIC